MSRYWSETTKRLKPYIPGEQPRNMNYIKLNTNENPYPPSPRVIEAVCRAAGENLRLYPEPECDGLRETAAQYFGVKKENVYVGNGSDELLAFSFLAFFDSSREILFPDITYTFYPVYCSLFNIGFKTVPLDGDFSVPVPMLCRSGGGVVLPNPNAPTGKYLPVADIKTIIEHNQDGVVIIDEAYVAFGGETVTGLIGQYPNLLVIHTLSKSHSLAGLRVGFAIGHEDLIEGLSRIKNSVNSYTMDRLALAGAAAALEDRPYFEETRLKIINTRKRILGRLSAMGFDTTDSMANFIFARHPSLSGAELFTLLKERGILVRHFNMPRIKDFLRITVGSDEEMDRLVEVLEDIEPERK